MPVDHVTVVYDVDVKGAEKNLDALRRDVKKLEQQFQKSRKASKDNTKEIAAGAKKAGAATNQLNGLLKNTIGLVGAAFVTQRLIAFAKQAALVAANAEDIVRAFDRLNQPGLLGNLRKAVSGTVSDIELMKQSVRASNFKIPLTQLATLFEFANRRARETGESVDFLVNSIISGIGRKSPLILDNLGISAVELRKRFDGVSIAAASVGDVARIVGDIASDELKKMGDDAETGAVKIQQMTAAWENMTLQIGQRLSPVVSGLALRFQLINELLTTEEELVNRLTGQSLGAFSEKMHEATDDEIVQQIALITHGFELAGHEIGKATQEVKLLDDQYADLTKQLKNEIFDEKRRKELREQLELIEARKRVLEEEIVTAGKSREIFEQQLKTLKGINSARQTGDQEQIRNVAAIREDLKVQKGIIEGQFSTIKEIKTARREQIKLEEELAALLSVQDRLLKDQLATEKLILKEQEFLTTPKADDGSVGVQERASEAIKSNLRDLADFNAEQDRIQKEEAEKRAQQAREAFLVGATGLANELIAINQAVTDSRLQELQRQLNEGQITEEQFLQKKKELLRDEARNQKVLATFIAVIDGAAAVVKALSVGGPPAAVAAGVIAAAQLAAIQARPIPEFAEGTTAAPGGMALIGEKGPEVMFVPKGAKIIPNHALHSEDIDAMIRGDFQKLGKGADKSGVTVNNNFDDRMINQNLKRLNRDSINIGNSRELARQIAQEQYFGRRYRA